MGYHSHTRSRSNCSAVHESKGEKVKKILVAVLIGLALDYSVGTYLIIPNLPVEYHFQQVTK